MTWGAEPSSCVILFLETCPQGTATSCRLHRVVLGGIGLAAAGCVSRGSGVAVPPESTCCHTSCLFSWESADLREQRPTALLCHCSRWNINVAVPSLLGAASSVWSKRWSRDVLALGMY